MEGWVLATVYATIAMVVAGVGALAFMFNPLLCLIGLAALLLVRSVATSGARR
jgi:hypothetical protein